jgi:hypothetical protein
MSGEDFVGLLALLGSTDTPADRAAAVFLCAEPAGPQFRRWLLRHAHLVARGGPATLLREALSAADLSRAARAALAEPGSPRLRAEPIWTTRRPDLDARLWTHETGMRVVRAEFDATGEQVLVFGAGTPAGSPESARHHAGWLLTLSGDGERRLARPIGQPRDDQGTFAVSPKGTVLAIRDWREVAVFALPAYERLQTLRPAGTEGPDALHFLDERRMLMLDPDALRLWDVRTGDLLAEQRSTGWADLSVTPDRRFVMVTGAGQTSSWYGPHAVHELPSLRLVRRFATPTMPRASQPHTAAIDIAPSGRFVVTGDWNGEVWLWDLSGRFDADLVPATRLGRHKQGAEAVRFVDEHTVASGGNEGAVHIWDTRRPGHDRRLGSHAAAVTAVDVSPDRRTLLTAAIDGTVCRWDLTAPGDEPPPWTAGYHDWQPIPVNPVDIDGVPIGALGVESDPYEPTDPASLRLDIREAGRVVDAIHLDGAPVYVTYLDATTLAMLDRDAHLTAWRLR